MAKNGKKKKEENATTKAVVDEAVGEEEREEERTKPPKASSGVWFGLLVFLLLLGGLAFALDADLADAVVTFPKKEVAKSARERIETVVERSLSLRARGDYDQAYTVLMELHNELPEEPQVNLELARIYLEKEDNGLFPFAEDYLSLAAEALPRSAKIAYFQGVLAMRKGEELLRRGRLAAARGNEWLKILTQSDRSLKEARAHFDRSASGPSPFNLAKAREFRGRCRKQVVENGISAARSYRDMAQGSFGVNPATLGLGLKRIHDALSIEGISGDERRRLEALKAELERGK